MPVLSVDGLTVSRGERRIFESLSFSFEGLGSGGVHGILAPSGAGKSTLLAAMAGVIPVESGKVMLCGKNILEDITLSKRKIGYVPEKPSFYGSMTVYETLDFVGEAKGISSERRYKQIKEALSLVGLEDIKNRLTRKLSADQTRCLSVACALLGNPDILLFDEVIVGSSESREAMRELVQMLGKIKTVVLASADFATARALCEDVAILSDGKLMACDTFEALEAKLLRHRVLELTVRRDTGRVCAAIEGICGVVSCEEARNPRTGEVRIRIEHRADTDIREDISRLLGELDVPILSMSVSALSLEDIYLSLVSATTREKVSHAVDGGESINEKAKKFGRKSKGGRK